MKFIIKKQICAFRCWLYKVYEKVQEKMQKLRIRCVNKRQVQISVFEIREVKNYLNPIYSILFTARVAESISRFKNWNTRATCKSLRCAVDRVVNLISRHQHAFGIDTCVNWRVAPTIASPTFSCRTVSRRYCHTIANRAWKDFARRM